MSFRFSIPVQTRWAPTKNCNIIANITVVFSMTNRVLFGVVCAVIFAVFSLVYLGVYRLTSHTYYKLVKT